MLTHIATTESVSLCVADEKLTTFLELESAVRMSGWACIKNQARPN